MKKSGIKKFKRTLEGRKKGKNEGLIEKGQETRAIINEGITNKERLSMERRKQGVEEMKKS